MLGTSSDDPIQLYVLQDCNGFCTSQMSDEEGTKQREPYGSRDHCKLLQIQSSSSNPKLWIGEPHNGELSKGSSMIGRRMRNAF